MRLYSIFIIIIINLMVADAQVDSVWTKSLTLGVANQRLPINKEVYQVLAIEPIFKKGNHTLIPSVTLKSLYDINGLNFRLSYYKKWRHGYSYVIASFSKSDIFPKSTFQGKTHINVFGGLELGVGGQYSTYQNESTIGVFDLSSTYYLGSYMFHYGIKAYSNNQILQNIYVRKYFSSVDYIQLAFYAGTDPSDPLRQFEESVILNTVNANWQHSLTEKVSINMGIGLIDVSSGNINHQVFNFNFAITRKL